VGAAVPGEATAGAAVAVGAGAGVDAGVAAGVSVGAVVSSGVDTAGNSSYEKEKDIISGTGMDMDEP
jgi:hypothetical protein